MTRRNIRHYLPASGHGIPFYDVIGNMAGSNKRWRQRRFEPSQPNGVLKKMINGNVRWNWFYYDLQVCIALQVLFKTVSHLWYNAYKKYKNSINQSYLYSASYPASHMPRRKWQFQFREYAENYQKKQDSSNVIFLRTADRIGANFCMTIKKIKPNDIFQNCVHSTSTLGLDHLNVHWQNILLGTPQQLIGMCPT